MTTISDDDAKKIALAILDAPVRQDEGRERMSVAEAMSKAAPSADNLFVQSTQNCEHCRFSHVFVFSRHECRRHAPAAAVRIFPSTSDIDSDPVWPAVYGHDWCGDFEPRTTDDPT
ncbi:MAG: hypothetical protein IT190_08865 [Microbacteriaceae bacterium]|nr:hypothetical protein [Microbacteriaceae bacterium]